MAELTKSNIKRYIINAVCIVLLIFVFMLYMNQDLFYDIKGENLENTFLQDIENRHDFKNGEVIDKNRYKNSITLFYEGEYGNIAATTYIKSLYSDKWKEVWSMVSNRETQDWWGEGFDFTVNDHIYIYNIQYVVKQGRFFTEFENVTKPRALLLRLAGFAIILVCSFIANYIAQLRKI